MLKQFEITLDTIKIANEADRKVWEIVFMKEIEKLKAEIKVLKGGVENGKNNDK